ncbi:hypothetical protein [Streptomyces sp. NBC_00582]|uniref:hypothetical protein n=1 Tax=Streptomyces sp. NBC_00582 TaxID=2975783 RepID=UPI001063E3FD|nr:hypothetical protein [Streptomyces sp. NBC_00582]WUB60279.1 hypothetical protein OG852_07695 [Streptomyces sp. NBC_00582]
MGGRGAEEVWAFCLGGITGGATLGTPAQEKPGSEAEAAPSPEPAAKAPARRTTGSRRTSTRTTAKSSADSEP